MKTKGPFVFEAFGEVEFTKEMHRILFLKKEGGISGYSKENFKLFILTCCSTPQHFKGGKEKCIL